MRDSYCPDPWEVAPLDHPHKRDSDAPSRTTLNSVQNRMSALEDTLTGRINALWDELDARKSDQKPVELTERSACDDSMNEMNQMPIHPRLGSQIRSKKSSEFKRNVYRPNNEDDIREAIHSLNLRLSEVEEVRAAKASYAGRVCSAKLKPCVDWEERLAKLLKQSENAQHTHAHSQILDTLMSKFKGRDQAHMKESLEHLNGTQVNGLTTDGLVQQKCSHTRVDAELYDFIGSLQRSEHTEEKEAGVPPRAGHDEKLARALETCLGRMEQSEVRLAKVGVALEAMFGLNATIFWPKMAEQEFLMKDLFGDVRHLGRDVELLKSVAPRVNDQVRIFEEMHADVCLLREKAEHECTSLELHERAYRSEAPIQMWKGAESTAAHRDVKELRDDVCRLDTVVGVLGGVPPKAADNERHIRDLHERLSRLKANVDVLQEVPHKIKVQNRYIGELRESVCRLGAAVEFLNDFPPKQAAQELRLEELSKKCFWDEGFLGNLFG